MDPGISRRRRPVVHRADVLRVAPASARVAPRFALDPLDGEAVWVVVARDAAIVEPAFVAPHPRDIVPNAQISLDKSILQASVFDREALVVHAFFFAAAPIVIYARVARCGVERLASRAGAAAVVAVLRPHTGKVRVERRGRDAAIGAAR